MKNIYQIIIHGKILSSDREEIISFMNSDKFTKIDYLPYQQYFKTMQHIVDISDNDFISKIGDKLTIANWNYILQNFQLSEELILKYAQRKIINFSTVSRYQKLSEKFMEENQDSINWHDASKYQKMSESFLRKMKHKIIWTNFLTHQHDLVSDKFISEISPMVNWNAMLYIDIDDSVKERFGYLIKSSPFDINNYINAVR